MIEIAIDSRFVSTFRPLGFWVAAFCEVVAGLQLAVLCCPWYWGVLLLEAVVRVFVCSAAYGGLLPE